MTDHERPNSDPTPSDETVTRPPMSRTAPPPAETSSTAEASAAVVEPPKQDHNGAPANGQSTVETENAATEAVAQAGAKARETLLQVESYDQAETLLSDQPELVDPARVVFGSVVPTTGQNAFVDLAIQAAADDGPVTLNQALQTKRRRHINLTGSEVAQVLEFADQNVVKSPRLALYIAILSTDDLSHLEDSELWQAQKAVITTTAATLGVDAMAIWEGINGTEAPPEPEPKPKSKPKPEPVKAEATTPPVRESVLPPPPPVRVVRTKRATTEGPPRWALAAGFVFLLSMMSCGVCALSIL